MKVTIKSVIEAFDLLFTSINNRKFRKTLSINKYKEKDLLPLVRMFLLGYFGESIVPEAKTKLPGALTGSGYLDFLIGDVAVEFACRPPHASRQNLSATVNSSEAKKLLKHDGLSVLILFDFSKDPFPEEKIESFRNWPSLGKGNHKKSPFNVAYFHFDRRNGGTKIIRKNIRV